MRAVTNEAEQNLLGGLMLDNTAWDRLAGTVSAEDFDRASHRVIFGAIAARAEAGEPFDVVTLAEYLERIGQLGAAGGFQYITDLAESTISPANVRVHAAIVAEKARRRSLQALFTEAARSATSGDLDELIGDVMSRTESTRTSKGRSLGFGEAVTQTLGHIDEAAAACQRNGTVGVPTGLPAIDRRTGGLLDGRLYVLAARPSIGKTALANQIALHAAGRGHTVGIISLEMTAEELVTRAFAHTYGVNFTGLTQGHDDALSELTRGMAAHPIDSLHIMIDTETTNLGAIVARLSEWRRAHGVGLAIVDHIGLIEGGDAVSRNDWLGKVSRTLKLTAKRLAIPILAVSQLNRSVEREKRRPVLADLRDSGNIEQDVDVAVFLHHDPNGQSTIHGIPMEIGLLKNRTGRRGWLPEAFYFDGATQTFREIIALGGQHRGREGADRAAGW